MNSFQILDAQELQIKTVQAKSQAHTINCDILIVGGSMGGVAAALSALKPDANGNRLRVCLTEETKWLGGQMTSQAVSALDENWLVETTGAALDYINLRLDIRKHYLSMASDEGKKQKYFHPGNSWVTRLSFEPKAALDAIDGLLKPGIDSGALSVYLRHKCVKIETTTKIDSSGQNKIEAKKVLCLNLENEQLIEFSPKIVLDATECGDLLPLAGLDYVFGQESKEDTGEAHAPAEAAPQNVQDFVYPFVLEMREGENHTIQKPDDYETLRDYRKFSLLGFKMFDTAKRENKDGTTSELLPFWTYRRLIDKDNFKPEFYPRDISMINWESNDTRDMNFLDKTCEEMKELLQKAKDISLSFLYWLQTEAPHDDGVGRGFPQFMLCKDLLGSKDGLSLYPYIRESRRIKALTTIKESDIGAQYFKGTRSRHFKDSVGIGLYPIDIHGRQEPGAAQATKPFQIPYGSLVPHDGDNILAACKNIGTTHITNGAYRLHPIEWSIGTACGAAARLSLRQELRPWQIHGDEKLLKTLQTDLLEDGNPIFWFEDLPLDDPKFTQIQLEATWQETRYAEDSLSCNSK
ncbi:MAG: FAD-dependent oxidoreductase [Cyanobacteria bacterium TGS_CYA1]|nr:FAD-dependent oxidoreductase [Cyanobacteria bacterium TGS_CYA1]